MEKMYFDIALLVGKYLANDLTSEEQERLNQWLELSKENREWFDRITDATYQSEKDVAARNIDIERGWQALQAKRTRVVNKTGRKRWLYAGGIAATLALSLGVLSLMKDNRQPLNENPPVFELAEITVPTLVETRGNDIILSYDSLNLEQSTRVYNAKVRDRETEEADTMIRYKKVIIPAGYTYQVLLADGSKVTLNAGSTLKFPEHFSTSSREVELTGEGFFEVAKAAQPFIVKAGMTQVTVYGTRFNLFFSEKLQLSEAVLLEGSIGMLADNKEVKITPNQRVCHNLSDHNTTVDEVNPADYINWMNHSFKYNNTPLKRIVFDISQWYGIEIKLDPNAKQENYSLEFDKSASIDWVIRMLEKIIGKNIKEEGGVYRIE